MSRIVDIHSSNPLHGTRRCCDGYSALRFTVSAANGLLIVSGVDADVGETPEIHELHEISIQPDVARELRDVTYTFTAQETWERD